MQFAIDGSDTVGSLSTHQGSGIVVTLELFDYGVPVYGERAAGLDISSQPLAR